jgi:hypothetical protein
MFVYVVFFPSICVILAVLHILAAFASRIWVTLASLLRMQPGPKTYQKCIKFAILVPSPHPYLRWGESSFKVYTFIYFLNLTYLDLRPLLLVLPYGDLSRGRGEKGYLKVIANWIHFIQIGISMLVCVMGQYPQDLFYLCLLYV